MATKVRVLLSAVLVLTAMWLVDCGHYTCGTTFGNGSCTSGGSGGIGQGGGGGNIQNPAAFDYFFEGGNLNAAFLNTSNSLNLIPNFASPPLGLGATDGMVVVQKKWLYIDEGVKVAAFSINAGTGALTALTGSPFAASSTESAGMIADPAGKFIFLSAANDAQVVVFAINQTNGTLTAVGSFPTASFAGEATTDGLGKYLYVTQGNLGSEVSVYVIGATGALTPIAGSPFSISIAQLRGEPTGKFLLGITGNGVNNGFGADNHIYVYSIDQTTGALTAVTGSPFATVFIPGNLEVHPSGKFVYTFNGSVSGPSPAEGYQFDTTTGAVIPVVGSPFTAATASDGKFDQSGAFLFTHPSTTLAVFSVSSTTGALASIAPPITGIGSPSEFVVTDP
jgi:lactonase family protein with 7-bladed beta-propeller